MTLKPFQKQDLARAALKDGLILSWDTGLGKTWALFLWSLLKCGFERVPGRIYVSGSRTDDPGATLLFIGIRRGPRDGDCYLTDSANHRILFPLPHTGCGDRSYPESVRGFDLPKGLTNLCGYTIHITKLGTTNDLAVLHVPE